jgi:arylsulfatase A
VRATGNDAGKKLWAVLGVLKPLFAQEPGTINQGVQTMNPHFLFPFLLGLAFLSAARADASAPRTPNVVIILADDLGYGDVQCYNPERGRILTPRIDRLAAEGLRFTDGHSSSGVCTPSRYSLLTGRYHWRTRLQSGIVEVFGAPLIAPDRMTLGDLARAHGYRTGIFGKWHLGWDWGIPPEELPFYRLEKIKESPEATPAHRQSWQRVFSKRIGGGPLDCGFDEYFGVDIPNWPPFCFIEGDRTVGIPSGFLPKEKLVQNQASIGGPALAGWTLEPNLPRLVDRSIEFIQRQARAQKPFLVYVSLTTPHTPLAVNEPWRGKSGLNNAFADLVMETDHEVGRVLDALETAGAAANTLVLFTADNGCAPYIGIKDLEAQGHFPSGPLRGYKADAWEGGHRVPFIVRWPGVVKPASISARTIGQVDLMATVADILGARLPPDAAEDSISFLPALRGDDGWERGAPLIAQSITGVFAIREGRWKLQLGPGSGGGFVAEDSDRAARRRGLPELQLYDLAADLGETRNLHAERPEIAAGLLKRLNSLVEAGRSTPGTSQTNDVPVDVFGAARRAVPGYAAPNP